MAITKIQSGAIPADAINTTHIGNVGSDKITGQLVSDQLTDLAVTHAKLHTTMDLSSKTVTLPTLSTLNTTGNVGIGTSSSVTNSTLNVNGGINITTGIIGYATNDSFTLNGRTQPHYGCNFTGSSGNPSGISGYYGISFAADGAEKMRIDSSGNVGIGIDNPTAKLTITDENAGQAMLQVRNFSTSATGGFGNAHSVELRSATSTTTHGVLIHHNENAISRRSLDVSDNNGIFASFVQGKVGIGTTTPAQLLEVSGNGGKSRFTRGGSAGTLVEYYYGANPAGGIQVQSTGLGIGGAARENDLFIKTNGNVGIGTSSPGYKLQVDHSTGSEYVSSIRNTADNLQLLLGTTTGGLINIQGKTISNNAAYQIALQAEGGNVGIGTTNAQAKLHVDGTIYADTGLSVQSVTKVGTNVGGVSRQRFHRLITTGAGQEKFVLMRYGRHWWGVGFFEIIIRGTYYGGNSKLGVFTVNGHTRGGLASISSHNNNVGTATPFAENYNSTHESCDISINLPGYEYYNIEYNIQHSYQQSAADDVGIHVGNSNAFFLNGTVTEMI